jgi:hypothetical protein
LAILLKGCFRHVEADNNLAYNFFFLLQEAQRADFESNRDQLLHAHAMEKEEMTTRAERQAEELQEELAKVQRDRDEALLLAENDRQQVKDLIFYILNVVHIFTYCQICLKLSLRWSKISGRIR